MKGFGCRLLACDPSPDPAVIALGAAYVSLPELLTNADIVTVIDLKTWQVAGRLTAGKEPDGLGYSPVTLKP